MTDTLSTEVPIERRAPEKNKAALADAAVTRIANQRATGQYVAYNKAGIVLGWLDYRDEKNR
ncbi:MAG: hypothetical protein LBB58_03890, partial [Cellulomonadaceae bacterium]|nr:hypothetical protein [Cellulomonadaceae bacterium]